MLIWMMLGVALAADPEAPQSAEMPPVEGITVVGDIVTTGLDADKTRTAVLRHLGSFNYCYQLRLKEDPTLSGELLVGITVKRDDEDRGVWQSGTVTGELSADERLKNCIAVRPKRLLYPPPAEGQTDTIKVPLSFHPVSVPPPGARLVLTPVGDITPAVATDAVGSRWEGVWLVRERARLSGEPLPTAVLTGTVWVVPHEDLGGRVELWSGGVVWDAPSDLPVVARVSDKFGGDKAGEERPVIVGEVRIALDLTAPKP